jgi:hypothetical protein
MKKQIEFNNLLLEVCNGGRDVYCISKFTPKGIVVAF